MSKHPRRTLRRQDYSISIAVLSWVLTAACSRNDGNYFVESNSSVSSGGAAVTNDAFSLKFTPDDETVSYYSHKFGSFSTPCSIANGASLQELNCLINMREEDVYFHDLTMSVNVPAGMCAYVTHVPYYYYTMQPGVGASTFQLVVSAAGVITSCTIDGAAGTNTGSSCSDSSGESTVSAAGAVKCAYDYSSIDQTYPNCCVGDYSVSLVNIAADGTSTTSNTTGKYGGSWSKCLAGPAMQTEWPKTASGYPFSKIVDALAKGYSVDTKINSPMKTWGTGTNFEVANFWNWAGYAAGTWSVTTSVPVGIVPVQDLSGSTLAAANPRYSYRCLNQAGELQYAIYAYINEWNVKEVYDKYISSKGDTSNSPNTTGLTGTDCSAVTTSGKSCNSIWDYDELSASYGASAFPLDRSRGTPP